MTQSNGTSLETWISDPACSIGGAKEAPKYEDYILPLSFTRRLGLEDVDADLIGKSYGYRIDREIAMERELSSSRNTEREHSCSQLNTPNGGLESPPSTDDCSPSFYQRDAEVDAKRNRLPHWQQGHVWVFVTWRLGDSVPTGRLRQWREERDIWLKKHPEPWDTKTWREYFELFNERIDHWLDQGMGSCVLRDPENGAIVAGALHHFNGQRYEIASFVVMPNHVHALFRPLGASQLEDILKSWKGYTAREINKRLDQRGSLWQEDYWDRLVRSQEHFEYYLGYIANNPRAAGLPAGEYIYFRKEREHSCSPEEGEHPCSP